MVGGLGTMVLLAKIRCTSTVLETSLMPRLCCIAVMLLTIGSAVQAEDTLNTKLVFEDSFERATIGDDWSIPIKTFSIKDGRLVGHEEPARGHGAVIRVRKPFKNAVIGFSFRMVDGKAFNFVVNDKNCKSVHAGHICRVVFTPTRIRIADDKEGAMKNEIFVARKDPKRKDEMRAFLKDKSSTIARKVNKDWHKASISIVGDTMSVKLDGQAIGKFASPGIAHPTKTDFGFTVTGNEIEFDDIKMWSFISPSKP